MRIFTWFSISILTVLLYSSSIAGERMDTYQIYEEGKFVRIEPIKYPSWFKPSFFNLQQELAEARENGKRGVVVMLGFEGCHTCRALLKTTFSDKNIITRLRKQYDVIGMDIFSELDVITPDGTATIVRDYAEQVSARMTPTLLFYGSENVLLVKIVGFYPPEKFQHVLDYIDEAHYSTMTLSDYLDDKRISSTSGIKSVTRDTALFGHPDHTLDVIDRSDQRHLLVVFEHPDCNSCDRFHQRVLAYPVVRKKFPQFRTVQLDATDNTSHVHLPDGRILKPGQWYDELQLAYDVVTVFFDETGNEVLRHDGEIGRYRMAYTMDYVLAKGYLTDKQVLRWVKKRKQQNLIRNKSSTPTPRPDHFATQTATGPTNN